jgi:nicotinamide mononucleotide adenylyltransferase
MTGNPFQSQGGVPIHELPSNLPQIIAQQMQQALQNPDTVLVPFGTANTPPAPQAPTPQPLTDSERITALEKKLAEFEIRCKRRLGEYF